LEAEALHQILGALPDFRHLDQHVESFFAGQALSFRHIFIAFFDQSGYEAK